MKKSRFTEEKTISVLATVTVSSDLDGCQVPQ